MDSVTSIAESVEADVTQRERFVDSSTFLGMHALDDRLRRSCTGFFRSMMAFPLAMSFEEVGRCDDVIWSQPRDVQDAYFPFMDYLHTELPIRRVALRKADIDAAESDPRLKGLPDTDRFAVGMAIRSGAMLITANPRLLSIPRLPVTSPGCTRARPSFPSHLEVLYKRSLVLRLPIEDVVG